MNDPSIHLPADADHPAEGVIQFAYDLQAPDGPPMADDRLLQLQAWREILRDLGLLGQDPNRYHGLGFGNMSARDPEHPETFAITASQTGAVKRLSQADLVQVLHCNLGRFWVDARGTQPPSSETMTHGMIYAADPEIHWVFHCHSPDIWCMAERMALPCTPENVAYGSPAMTAAVVQVLRRHGGRPVLFATLGHEDGVFACGSSAEEVGSLLVATLARSRY